MTSKKVDPSEFTLPKEYREKMYGYNKKYFGKDSDYGRDPTMAGSYFEKNFGARLYWLGCPTMELSDRLFGKLGCIYSGPLNVITDDECIELFEVVSPEKAATFFPILTNAFQEMYNTFLADEKDITAKMSFSIYNNQPPTASWWEESVNERRNLFERLFFEVKANPNTPIELLFELIK